VESTILAIDGDRLIQLRAGALARDTIEEAMGQVVELAAEGAAISAPGMLLSHYAPNAHMRLDTTPRPGEAYLAFGTKAPHNSLIRNLSETGDLHEAARNLFSMLHELDAACVDVIAVAPIPEIGLGEAINDRLRRAAAPR
jgi:L-threonylcarbamoyladenylate synthase